MALWSHTLAIITGGGGGGAWMNGHFLRVKIHVQTKGVIFLANGVVVYRGAKLVKIQGGLER